MSVGPTNPNLVRIGMVRTGCFKTQFNSTYPTRLRGIINQPEFEESINNINSKISGNKLQNFCIAFFILYMVGGIITFIVAIVASTSRSTSFAASFTILFGIGGGLIGCSPLFLVIGCCIVRCRRTSKMQHAVAEESKKYSGRSPIPSSWRLDKTKILAGRAGHRRVVYIYHIIIDIGRPVASSGNASLHPNQTASRPPSTTRPSSTTRPLDDAPPPYPGLPTTFCFQCSVPRPDPAAKFCTSCGYSFDKY